MPKADFFDSDEYSGGVCPVGADELDTLFGVDAEADQQSSYGGNAVVELFSLGFGKPGPSSGAEINEQAFGYSNDDLPNLSALEEMDWIEDCIPALSGYSSAEAREILLSIRTNVYPSLERPSDKTCFGPFIGSANHESLRELSQDGVGSVVTMLEQPFIGKILLQPIPRTIPLHIALGPHLTNRAEIVCAEVVAQYLSRKCGRFVALDELVGLALHLWSEDDPDGHELTEYLTGERRPLQGQLLQAQDLAGTSESLANAELAKFLGQRFELVAGVVA